MTEQATPCVKLRFARGRHDSTLWEVIGDPTAQYLLIPVGALSLFFSVLMDIDMIIDGQSVKDVVALLKHTGVRLATPTLPEADRARQPVAAAEVVTGADLDRDHVGPHRYNRTQARLGSAGSRLQQYREAALAVLRSDRNRAWPRHEILVQVVNLGMISSPLSIGLMQRALQQLLSRDAVDRIVTGYYKAKADDCELGT